MIKLPQDGLPIFSKFTSHFKGNKRKFVLMLTIEELSVMKNETILSYLKRKNIYSRVVTCCKFSSNYTFICFLVSAENAKLQSARVFSALCQKAVDQVTPQNSNACEEYKFCDDCTQRAFSFCDDCPACADAHGLINPKRVDITTQRRRSSLDTQGK